MKHLKCVTLDSDNYFSWKAQFSALLRGYTLFGYVNGNIAIEEGSPAEQQDQLILSWVFSSISPSLLPQVAVLSTSAKVWECLCQMHSSDSETRILHLQHQLQNIRKENLPMSEYLKRICVLKDKLAAAGDKLKDSQVILIALGGLGPEFQSFVTSITMRFDHSMTFPNLQQLLMDHELRIAPAQATTTIEANIVTRPRSDSGRLKACQICSKKGHGDIDCYNRFNATRFPPNHKRKLTAVGVQKLQIW